LASKKLITKSIDPQSAIRMFIIESNVLDQNSSKLKRQENVLEQYKTLSKDQKYYIAEFTTDTIYSKYINTEKFNSILFSYFILSSSEENGYFSKVLIDILLKKTDDDIFTKKICEVLFEIIDQEFSIEENKRKVIAHCLSLVINIGINKFEENSKIKNKLNENNEIIDFITSSLLARGNINNIEIRIAIVYYLSRIDNNSKINLQKILSRFGQSLLEHVFTKYFSENETSKTAFLFLADHLKDFLSGSAHLAEMGNAVLQNQMLKNPVEFINFSDKYSDLIYEKLDELKSLNIHLSFLLKKSCEINKIELINGLQKIIIKNLNNMKNNSEYLFIESFENIIEIISKAHSKNIRDSINIITKFYQENTKKSNSNIIHKNFKHNKSNKLQNRTESSMKESPFEQIFLLAK
jgi:hypothetical protein